MGSRNLIICCAALMVLAGLVLSAPSSEADGSTFGLTSIHYDADSCMCTVSGNSPDDIVHIGIYSGETKLVEAYASTTDGAFSQGICLKGLPTTGLSVKIWNYSATAVDSGSMATIDTADYSRNSMILSVTGTAGDGIVHFGVFDSEGKKAYEFFTTAADGAYSATANLYGLDYGDYTLKAWDGSACITAQKTFKIECPQYTVTFKDFDGSVISEEVWDLGTKASSIIPADPQRAGEFMSYAFAGWDSEVKDVAADAVYTATYTEKPVHTIGRCIYDVSTGCITVSGTSGSEIVHIGVYSEGAKVLEAFATVKENRYSVDMNVEGAAFDTVKVWDSDVACIASEPVVGLLSADYGRMTKILTVSGLSDDPVVHVGVWSGQSKVLEAFAVPENGSYVQAISLAGLPAGDYTVKVWDSAADQIFSKDFELIPAAYKLTFSDGITVKNGDVVVEDGSEVVFGTELTVSAEAREGYNAVLNVELTDGVFVMPENEVSITADYQAITYTYTFMNGSEKFAEVKFTVEDIADQKMPAVPVKEHYSASWDVAGFKLEDRTVNAVFVYVVPSTSDKDVDVDMTTATVDTFRMPSEKKDTVTVEMKGSASVKVEDAAGLAGKDVTSKVEKVSSDVGGTAYELTFEVDGKGYAGSMLVTLPYTPVNGEKPVVYYVHDGVRERMEVVSYTQTSVTFKTTHNSEYIVTSEPVSESDDTVMVLAAIAVIVVVFIIGMLYAIRRLEKQNC